MIDLSKKLNLVNGDCLEVLKEIPENSVDSCVTDPPYGLGFMGKHWDKGVPDKVVLTIGLYISLYINVLGDLKYGFQKMGY